MKVIGLEEIKGRIRLDHAIALQEEGFRLYSAGKVIVPPVGYMKMEPGGGEVHIKYGWLKDDPFYVVKIAGAYAGGVHGMMMGIDAYTGVPQYFLQDEGYLTNLRTAIAGLIAAKYLAPKKVEAIGILGTGMQARLQVELLQEYTNCRELWVWGRNPDNVRNYIQDMKEKGFDVHVAESPRSVCRHCNLIVTTTAARQSLLCASEIQPGTHITAVGADAPGKQELDPEILRMAERVAVDSKAQCLDHGELAYFPNREVVELGAMIANPSLGRQNDQEITVADLTGVGVQDIQIAKAVMGH